jgi:hypothetical protein
MSETDFGLIELTDQTPVSLLGWGFILASGLIGWSTFVACLW